MAILGRSMPSITDNNLVNLNPKEKNLPLFMTQIGMSETVWVRTNLDKTISVVSAVG